MVKRVVVWWPNINRNCHHSESGVIFLWTLNRDLAYVPNDTRGYGPIRGWIAWWAFRREKLEGKVRKRINKSLKEMRKKLTESRLENIWCSLLGMMSRDSGIELVDALFGTRRNEVTWELPRGEVAPGILRNRSRIEGPSDSAPDEFDGRLSWLYIKQ